MCIYPRWLEGILQEAGHKTLSAGSADQALALLEEGEKVDVIFTDITLQSDPHAGLVLAQEAIKRKTEVPVLYTTGQGLTDAECKQCSLGTTDI